MDRSRTTFRFLFLLIFIGGVATGPLFAKERVNVVFILTDNHGAWTLGCYGNPDIRTPHIDQMAKEGIRFENAFCNNAVCSPTRATYLTGLMPSQHGVHNFLVGNRLQTGPEARNTLADFTSLPEILKANGYACGLVGKWHLGDNLNPSEGFEDYWITMPHGGTSTFHDARIIENGEIRKEPTYLTDFWTDHALNFLDENQDEPFFLFLAYNGPYGLSSYQLESSGNRHSDYYADKEMPSFPRGVNHPWQFPNRAYFGNLTSIRRYGEELSAVDDGVGSVLAHLKKLGLEEKTLVVFAADQGWAGGQRGIWGMGDHTRPVNAFEHSMRIPLIFRHPGVIPGDRVSPLATSNYDFMPTVLGYLGLRDQIPIRPTPPGRDYSFELKETISPYGQWGDEVFYEYESLRCIRNSHWKLIDRYDDEDYHELYHLSEDPDELVNLYGHPDYADVQAVLQNHLDLFFSIHASDEYDLWNGGGAQTKYYVWDKSPEQELDAAIEGSRPWAPSVIDPTWNPPPIELPDGLVAEVAAAPPLVKHPVMATLDDRGRLFVCENAGLNLKREELEAQKPNSIRVLDDRNGDGIYDRSTVFADDLTFPQGALWLEDALYVMSPPSLWRFRDTDGDNVADERTELVAGFDYTGNAADVHGPFLHPNGRLFWCHGRKGHEVHDPATGQLVSKNKGARIWSCLPDGSDVQVFAGGGMDNPVELVFAPNGDIIGDVNLFYGRPRGDTLVHWLEGGVYPRRDQEAVISEFPRTGPLLNEIHNFGHVAVSGICLASPEGGIIPHPAAPDELGVLATHFNTQKITHSVLERSGSTWGHQRTSTLLKFNDPDVHLTDVLQDSNGDLLILDTGGWFRIGCPTSQMAKPEVTGAIYRIRPAGKRRKNKLEKINIFPPPEDAMEQYKPGQLKQFFADTISPKVRIEFIWAMIRADRYPLDALFLVLMKDPHEDVRQTACAAIRWASLEEPNLVETALIDLLLNDTPSVSRSAAEALAKCGKWDSAPALLELLERENLDSEHRHAGIHALIQLAHVEPLRDAISENLAPNRVAAALLALDAIEGSHLTSADLISVFDRENDHLRSTAYEIINRHPEWAPDLASALEAALTDSETRHLEEALHAIVPPHLDAAEMKALAARLLDSKGNEFDRLGFQLIRESASTEFSESWLPFFREALNSDSRENQTLALEALGAAPTNLLERELKSLSSNPSLPKSLRVRALMASGNPDQALPPSAFDLLTNLLSGSSIPQERLDAAILLGSAKLNEPQMIEVAGLTREAGPLELPHLLKVFQRTRSEAVGQALNESLPHSRGLNNVLTTDFQRLLNRFPPGSIRSLKTAIDEMKEKQEQRGDHLASLHPELASGDASRGEAVFRSGKGTCLICHQIGDYGRAVGPDLSTIGSIRTNADLLESILYPNESLARDFETRNVTLYDGSLHVGLIQRETTDSVFLTTAAAEEIVLPRASIRRIEAVPLSIMPAGLEHSLTKQELLDLIAYLKSLNGAQESSE